MEKETKIRSDGAMGARLLPFKAIPVIDIGPLAFDDAAAIRRTVDEIGLACETVGFFYIRNHGVPEAIVARAYALSRAFHHGPIGHKQRVHVSHSPGTRGWVPISAEDDDGDPEFYDLAERPPENDYRRKPRLHAAFDLSIEIDEDDPDFLAGNIMLVPNQWPNWIPGFREGILDYHAKVAEVGRRLFTAFEMHLGLPEGFFAERTRKAPSQLRLLHYPPNDLPMNNTYFGIGAHSDFECFTILNQQGPGLQVMNAADEWVAAPPIPDTFIVNIGDLLEGWTNGLFKATQHRVVNLGKERFSLPLFFAVDYHTVVEPLAQFVSPEYPPRYGRIVAGDHLAGFSVESCKHLRRKIKTGQMTINFPIHKENPFKRKAVNEFHDESTT